MEELFLVIMRFDYPDANFHKAQAGLRPLGTGETRGDVSWRS